jgi:hypothetical protein
MTSRSTLHRIAALAAVLVVAGCGSGMLDVGRPAGPSNGGGGASIGTPANYVGEVGDSLKSGTASLTVSSSLTVTGLLVFAGGPTVPLTGTVDTAAAAIHASGGGYTISGFTNLGTLSGSYTGPGGNGFMVATSDSLTGQTHKTYCGVYTSTNGNGRIAVQVLSSGDVGGFVVQTVGVAASSFFTGTVINNQTLSAVTNSAVGISGSISSDLATITGSYAPPVANTTTPGTATGQFSATTGGC